jgi:predicted HTH transcriptional regulator
LNTLDRPGTEPGLEAISQSRMQEIAEFLQPLPVNIIAKFQARQKISSFNSDIESTILETIRRRPCTAADLAEILGTHINEINKYLTTLLKADKISAEEQERGTFFRAR